MIHKEGSEYPERQESLNGTRSSPQIVVVSDVRSKHDNIQIPELYFDEGKPVNALTVKSQEPVTTISISTDLSSQHGGSQSLLLDDAPPGDTVNSIESIIIAESSTDTNNGNLAES